MFYARFFSSATTVIALCSLGLLISACSLPIKEQHYIKEQFITAPVNAAAITTKDPCVIYDNALHAFTVPKPTGIWLRIRKGFGIDEQAANNGSHRIAKRLSWYEKHPQHINTVAQRGELYLHYILEKLDERGLPYELALIPMAESGFDPFAYSHATASGLWQFMPKTGEHLGLKQNWWYDGRRDITASTEAALNYLTLLNQQFKGDWLLTLAAYNGGQGNVRRAIEKNRKKGKPTDYWSLQLPKETQHYIPKILALKEIILRPDIHNVTLPSIANAPYFALAQINSQLDLAHAAKLANVEIDELYQLNPGFKQWATAPDGPHRLAVPATQYDSFIQALQAVPDNERVTWQRYTIKKGDNLTSIAQKYHTNTQALQEINHLKGHSIIAGKTLLVPQNQSNRVDTLNSTKRFKNQQNGNQQGDNQGTHTEYIVKSGDSLWSIARQYNTDTRTLAHWNNISPRKALRINQKLIIWDAQANANTPHSANISRKITYTVRNGDSLAHIASKYNVSINELVRWNSLRKNDILKQGKKLVVHVNAING